MADTAQMQRRPLKILGKKNGHEQVIGWQIFGFNS
jgi:hypothetical protein